MARYAMTPSSNPFQRLTITTNTQVAERVGYGGKWEQPIEDCNSVAIHKRLFAAYWQAAQAINHTRYTLVGGKWYTVEETADGKVKVTRQ